MTAFVAILDAETGTIRYANAGQNFPYLVHMDGQRRLDQSVVIAASGNPLGDRTGALQLRAGSIALAPGDLFVAFTDGVVERQAPSGKQFGDRRLAGLFTGRALTTDGSGLVALRAQIREAVEGFAAGTVLEDDLTFVLCHYDPAGVA